MNYQNSGYQHTFPCGCVGVLPLRKGESNLFARWAGKCWHCRVSNIFSGSASTSKRDGYKPIDQNTPHSKVRMMMENPCVLCGEPLKWTFSNVKTPNLHHDHTTGYALGFAHPKCNSNGAGIENKCLRDFILDDVFGSERISFPLTAELLFTKIRRQQP